MLQSWSRESYHPLSSINIWSLFPSDLAALIKDKNRNIDKLETALERQSIQNEKHIQELNEEFSAKRAKMKEGLANTLEKSKEVSQGGKREDQ